MFVFVAGNAIGYGIDWSREVPLLFVSQIHYKTKNPPALVNPFESIQY